MAWQSQMMNNHQQQQGGGAPPQAPRIPDGYYSAPNQPGNHQTGGSMMTGSNMGRVPGAGPGYVPPVTTVAESPRFRRDGSPTSPGGRTLLTVAPNASRSMRDWEGLSAQNASLQQHMQQQNSPGVSGTPNNRGGPQLPLMVRREGSPSVGVLRDATERGNKSLREYEAKQSGNNAGYINPQAAFTNRSRSLNPQSPGAGAPTTPTNKAGLDHQGWLAFKREEYIRRQEAEARGEVFTPRGFPGGDHLSTLQGDQAITTRDLTLGGGNRGGNQMNVDFTGRSRKLPIQILADDNELAWMQPPEIPEPIGWNGFWDTCAGHELILQHLAVSGATPDNSPSLINHFMYPDLISCVQRLQIGSYMIRYHSNGEPPHERYFYLKSLPLNSKAQYAPFLCWAQHKNSHNAMDAIPLCNVMWVTQGIHSPHMKKYYLGGNAIKGCWVGKRPVECLAYGCFTIWYYDGANTKAIDVLATDPLVFTMWMKVLDDAAQMNAAVDTTRKVRNMQKYLEELKENGELEEVMFAKPKSKSLSERLGL